MPSPEVLPFPGSAEERRRLALFVPEQEGTPTSETDFEIGHVLFVDIVGYSRLLLDEQSECLEKLNEIVRGTHQFRRTDDEEYPLRLPTGDGMALVFRQSPEEPALCAFEIAQAAKAYPQLPLRMGVHSGPVNQVADVNGRANIAGAGINLAQRVMDCGDAGHILVSKHVAEDLEHSARWQPHLHPLGEYEVKHGSTLAVVNLYTAELGNAQFPTRLTNAKQPAAALGPPRSNKPYTITLALLLVVAALIAAQEYLWRPTVSAASSVQPQPSPPAPAVPEKSIAVLPFENLNTNQETAFFTDGVQDEILTNLAKVADLKVTSRTSVMQYRNLARRNLREIGQQLGVAYILEGSVQRIGNRIRINAQCIDARTDAHIWAQTYDRDLADVFAIQSEIAKTIAEQLRVSLSPNEQAEIEQKPTSNLEAYDFYLRAMQINRTRASSVGSGGVEEAKREARLLEQATTRDPAFVPALAQTAQVHLYLFWVNADDPGEHLEAAKRALEAAEVLQPNAGGVRLARALLYYWGARDYDAALNELALARQAMPNETRARFITAMIQRRQGHWEESTRQLEDIYQLDPFNVTIISELAGANYTAMGRYPEAIKVLDTALSTRPHDFAMAALRANVDFVSKADLRRWQELLDRDENIVANPGDLANARIDLALRERNYARANHLLGENPGNEFDDNGFFTPREWKQAIAARGLGDRTKARALFQNARDRVAEMVARRPDEAKNLVVLAQLEAALGNKEAAAKNGERAVALLPAEKDAINGPQLILRLAAVWTQLGERDRALDLLDRNAHQPYGANYGTLKLDEVWDPLRDDARFNRLVASIAPKN